MSDKSPKVSILVPVYNVEKYIERCATSLFEQSYENIEYVFVNDCSLDDSIQVLKQIIKRYPSREKSTRIISHEVNRGLAAARNTGVANSTGEFIVHVDSDDYLELNSVALLVEQQLNTHADIVTGNVLIHTDRGEICLLHSHYKDREDMVLDMMQTTISHSIWKRLIRKRLYDAFHVKAKEGINCGEDCWTMTQLAYFASSFSFVDEVVYHYDCTREDSYTARKKQRLNKNKIKDDIATTNLIIDFFKDKEQVFYDEANSVAIRYLNNILYSCARLNDKPFFNEVLSQMKSIDKKYWKKINWDNDMKRLLTQNFYSCKMVVSLLGLYGQIVTLMRL